MIMNMPGMIPKMKPSIPHISKRSLASLNLPWSMESKTVVFNRNTIRIFTIAEAKRYTPPAHAPKNSEMIPKTSIMKKKTK